MNSETTVDSSSRNRVSSLVVTTTHPPAATTSTTGGAVTLLCPHTGSIQAGGRLHGGEFGSNNKKQQWGVQGLSFFPTNNETRIALAYGTTGNDDDDDESFATLVSMSPKSSVHLHWRCRFPNSGAVRTVATLMDRYLLAGTSNGTLLVWNLWQDGALICTIPHAHYQAITSCLVVDSGTTTVPTMIITGGSDGRVHGWNVRDLVQQDSASSSIQPMRTWTCHQLPVTSLASIPGHRIVSAGEDGQVVMMDVAVDSKALLVVQVGHAVSTLATTSWSSRVYAGCANGSIHNIDLDQYALERSATRNGAVAVHVTESSNTAAGGGVLDAILSSGSVTDTVDRRVSVWHGHDRTVTVLAILDDDCLASGDAGGTIRMWDGDGNCIRVLQPWKTANSSAVHPVSSLTPVWECTPSPFVHAAAGSQSGGGWLEGPSGGRHKGVNDTFVQLFSPLQTIPSRPSETSVVVPFLRHQPSSDEELLGQCVHLFPVAKREAIVTAER